MVVATGLLAVLAVPVVAEAQRRAVPRTVAPRSRTTVIVGARFYNPYYFYRPFFYDPWYHPFGFSFAYGYPLYHYPYYPYYYGGYYALSASVRAQVTPRETEVYVDGYYAGTVDDFDGVFQRLHLEPGEHELQLFLPGHRTFTQKIYLQPGTTFRVRHTMEPLGPGEPEPERPAASPRTSGVRPDPYGRRDRPDARGPRRPAPHAGGRAADPDSDFGAVALRVQPADATITIDGERWEGSQDDDRLVVQLGAGTHTVEIRKDGYRTYITDITVRRGEETSLNVSLNEQ